MKTNKLILILLSLFLWNRCQNNNNSSVSLINEMQQKEQPYFCKEYIVYDSLLTTKRHTEFIPTKEQGLSLRVYSFGKLYTYSVKLLNSRLVRVNFQENNENFSLTKKERKILGIEEWDSIQYVLSKHNFFSQSLCDSLTDIKYNVEINPHEVFIIEAMTIVNGNKKYNKIIRFGDYRLFGTYNDIELFEDIIDRLPFQIIKTSFLNLEKGK